jgi:hypothetical protein
VDLVDKPTVGTSCGSFALRQTLVPVFTRRVSTRSTSSFQLNMPHQSSPLIHHLSLQDSDFVAITFLERSIKSSRRRFKASLLRHRLPKGRGRRMLPGAVIYHRKPPEIHIPVYGLLVQHAHHKLSRALPRVILSTQRAWSVSPHEPYPNIAAPSSSRVPDRSWNPSHHTIQSHRGNSRHTFRQRNKPNAEARTLLFRLLESSLNQRCCMHLTPTASWAKTIIRSHIHSDFYPMIHGTSCTIGPTSTRHCLFVALCANVNEN